MSASRGVGQVNRALALEFRLGLHRFFRCTISLEQRGALLALLEKRGGYKGLTPDAAYENLCGFAPTREVREIAAKRRGQEAAS